MNFKAALSDFNKAIKLKPDFAEALNNRTKVLRLITLDSVVKNNAFVAPEIKPEVLDFLQRTAQIYINQKEFEKATYYLNKGIELAPSEQTFHEMLAVMYQQNKEFDKSLDAFNNGLFYLPGNLTLILGRGLTYLDMGDKEKACKDFTFGAERGDNDAANMKIKVCGDLK